MTDEAAWRARLERERAARKSAERLLENKARELLLRNRELQELADTLETRVAVRTAELQTALADADTAVKDREELANDLQAVITAMPGVLIRVHEMGDGSWRRTYVGPGIQEMTGYSVEEALRPEWLNENLDPSEKGLINAQALWFSEHQFSVEYRFRHKKGHWIWVRRVARGHADSEGRRETIAIWNDVTREKSLSEQLAQSAKLAQLGEVATGMAHELNQPLAGISMAAENAQRSLSRLPEPPQRALEKLGLIVDLTKRASDIIDHMRIFGRSDTASRGPVSVGEVVKGAGQLLASKLNGGGVRLQAALPEGLPPVLGKAVPLEQVIMNLISNACDAYAGRPEPVPAERRVISVAAHAEADWVTIEVQDAAGGIPGEVLPRIFEPFFTTKPVGQGTGLGLSISYGIITDMGGTITAENYADGCLLRILLPVAR
jgi:PAS domain S-box-containing protein